MLVGAIGVGLGFGLQSITSNFFSGLILLFERPIRIGDRVEISGCVGEVKEIAARATTLVTDENVAIIVPNSQPVSERVTNWSRPGTLTAYIVPFFESHESDPQVWSIEHLKTAGMLKSDLNFEVWRQLAAAGVTISPVHAVLPAGVPLANGSSD